MALALFDLDHTLLDGDSNTLWMQFLQAQGLLDAAALAQQGIYMQQYTAGTLDIRAYLRFQLLLLRARPAQDWLPLRDAFVNTHIACRLSQAAHTTVAQHLAQGNRCAIITATHRFLADAIGALFAVPVIGNTPVLHHGFFTGEVLENPPCFGAGKLSCLAQWLAAQRLPDDALQHGWFYSDSSNDLPMLEAAGRPVAVNPDARLQALAQTRHWRVQRWHAAQKTPA